jgi:hypothetical protein
MPGGGSLDVLSGPVALTAIGAHPNWNVRAEGGRFVLVFDRAGVFPVQLKFNAAVGQNDGWSGVDFRVAPGILQPIVLQGLPADTQFQFADAARPERAGTNFTSFLPVDGAVKFSWKQARPEAEGKLFYAAEMESQISISPGLMRQVALLDGKVMQGEMNQITLRLHGDGEVTRVRAIRCWRGTSYRRPIPTTAMLVVQFNQPQKDGLRNPGADADAARRVPAIGGRDAVAARRRDCGSPAISASSTTARCGWKSLQASGLSQISPEQFPEGAATRAAFHPTGSQRFAYQFSSPDFALKIQADQILPEVGVSATARLQPRRQRTGH